MKKKNLPKILTLLLLSSTVYGTALAAETTLPADHWSYKAIEKLEKAGVLADTDDAAVQHTVTRQKMAELVEKAMNNSAQATQKQKALIDKLAVEFALELNGITVKEPPVQKSTPSLRVGFDTLMTASADSPAAGIPKEQGNDMWHWRARLTLNGDLNEKTTYNARLTTSFGTAGMTASTTSTTSPALTFDRVYIESKDLFGFDSVKWGRQGINLLGGNLAYKSGNNDGVILTKNLDENTKVDFGALVVKPEPSAVGTFSGNTQDVQYVAVQSKVSQNLKLGGMFFNNNTSVAKTDTSYNYSYSGSKIGGLSAAYKMGKFTMLSEFDQTHLSKASGTDASPHAYAFQITNGTVSPDTFYPISQTVTNINKKGDSAFVLSYRYTQKGAVPLGLGPWGGATITSPVTSVYSNSKIPNGIDNIKGIYFSYQYVLDKGIELSFDTQFLKYADTGAKFDNIYMLLLNTKF
jgi:hypothetical protein